MKPRRVVVKVGSSTITDERGRIDAAALDALVAQIAAVRQAGHQVVLVSSGAIAAGLDALAFDGRPSSVPELQATASVGQGLLMQRYAELFSRRALVAGQVLLTQDDITQRAQYLNARNALKALLDHGVVPVINENDATAVEEIRLGDNDTLAALVAILVKADLLVMLTDTEGLYAADPRHHEASRLIDRVETITPEIERAAGGAGTARGSGGMQTKIAAAHIATSARCAVVIAHGGRPDVLVDAVADIPVGTYFAAQARPLSARKLWIAFARQVRGSIVVDDGACDAICLRGRSLLAAGVVGVHGRFAAGDAVTIAGMSGTVLGRGLTNFSAHELEEVKGLRTDQVERRLPDRESYEVVHRDSLVILGQPQTGEGHGRR